MATTYLSNTFGSTTNRKTYTISFWMKRSKLGTDQRIIEASTGTDGNNVSGIETDPDRIRVIFYNTPTTNINLKTNALLRDVSGWYNIVLAIDTTQATSSDRAKLYLNGTQVTSFDTATYPSQNLDTDWNLSGNNIRIGRRIDSTPEYFDGSITHMHFIDGTAYTASAFGSTDATSGEWVINTSPSVTYGDNGFFILKDGNGITDQSGEGNDFTLGGGTLTDLQDCPDDVYATLNPLDNYYAGSTFSNGNTSQTSHAGAYAWVPSTLGMTKGKFYAECKQTGYSGGSNYDLIGIAGSQNDADTHHLGQIAYTAGYYGQGGVYNQSGSTTSTYASYTTNDIIGVAVDLDNNKLYFSKNGVWQNSGDPTSGATGTGALSITAPSAMTGTTSTGVYRFASGDYGNTVVVNNSWNFGNGYFGTTAISSEGTNASGIGKFEYDVPTGYTALSTKGLQE